ncbi:MAG: ELWxxDGT repeat protein [Pseudohongiellaceae bacterium]|jgi:ELWxxDGT repeat protein
MLIVDIEPGPGSAEPLFSAPPVVLGDTLFVIMREHGGAFALFSSDGTAAGTSKVLTTDPTGFLAEFVILKVVNDRLIFNANMGTGLELWSSDGTAAGTELLVDATPGGDSFFTTVFTGDTVAYFSTVVGSVHTIWSTDGTAAGTAAIFIQAGVPFFGGPQVRAAFGDSVVFTVSDPVFGIEPWISDGMPAGTVMLADIEPGSASSTTDGSGLALLPRVVPGSAALTGLVVDFQAFASEPGGPFLGAGTLKNVLEIVVGP